MILRKVRKLCSQNLWTIKEIEDIYYVLYNLYMNVYKDGEEGLHTLEGIWIELDTILLKMWNMKCHLPKTEGFYEIFHFRLTSSIDHKIMY